MRKLEFTSLQVRNLEISKHFYTTKLGFELSEMSNPNAYVFKYNKGEASFAIRKPLFNLDNKELGIGTSLWFAIDDIIEDFQASLIAQNVTIIGDINDTPFGKTVIVKDPDGYLLTFIQANS